MFLNEIATLNFQSDSGDKFYQKVRSSSQGAVWVKVVRFAKPKSNIVLTVQREHGVKDLALHLSCTLWGTAHPKPLVQTHSGDDGIASVRWLLPLGQGGGGNDADPATQCQEIAQQLEPWVSHPLYNSFPLLLSALALSLPVSLATAFVRVTLQCLLLFGQSLWAHLLLALHLSSLSGPSEHLLLPLCFNSSVEFPSTPLALSLSLLLPTSWAGFLPLKLGWWVDVSS